jgi:twitching motility protein PilT
VDRTLKTLAVALEQRGTTAAGGPVRPAGIVPSTAEAVFAEAIRLGASDVHLSAGSPPVVRVGGALGPMEAFDPLSDADVASIGRWVARTALDEPGDHDLAFVHAGTRFRANLYRQRGTPALACRLIPSCVPAFESLGLPPVLRRLAAASRGLVLLCGPTGSGKTTTLASMIDLINDARALHIVTIEDPIEYVHSDKRALIHQREIGEDAGGFAAALRSALRQDPDVILVGEMRDVETMDAALTAAETGHLVFSTLHTSTAEASVGRMVNAFPASKQGEVRVRLATVLRGVVCQTLIPHAADAGARCVATEVMVNTRAIANLIREGNTHQITSQLETSAADGMHTMDQDLARAVACGLVEPAAAGALASDERSFSGHLARASDRASDRADARSAAMR